MAKYDAATRTVLKASATERCLGKYFAPAILSNVGRIIFLVIYVILIAGACYGATQIEIQFDINYFVSKDSEINEYFEASDKFFNKGGEQTTTYVENPSTDWSSTESQQKMITFNKNW